MHESEKGKWSRSVVSDSSRPHGLQPTRLLRPWDSPGKSTGVGCHCLLQGWVWIPTKAQTHHIKKGKETNYQHTGRYYKPWENIMTVNWSGEDGWFCSQMWSKLTPEKGENKDRPVFSSVAQSCPTLCDPMNHSTPGLQSITNSRSPPRSMSIESVMPSNHLILCRPLLLLPPIPPSIRVFSNESALCVRWPKYWSFSFNISPSNEHPGLISFRMDWLDLLAVQGALKSLLQHHSSKASIPQRSAFFIVYHS